MKEKKKAPVAVQNANLLGTAEHRFWDKRWFWLLLFMSFSFIAYAPALNGPFFFDDEHFIVRNQTVHDIGKIFDIYASNTTSGSFISGNFYRPNQQLAYALLYQLVGTTTSLPYHLTSIVLHGAASFLLCVWFVILGFGSLAAIAGALVFLLHPVQSESVAYISGMSDPIGIVFLLGGLICYTRAVLHRATIGWGWIFGSFYCFIMALLSRENTIVFAPLVTVLTLFLRRSQPRIRLKSHLWLLVAIWIPAAAYFALKLTVFNFGNGFGLTDRVNIYTQDITVRLTTFISVLWDYAVLLFYPADLFYEKPYRAYLSLLEPRGLFGLALILVLLLAVFNARRWPRFALSLAFAACALTPFCGAVPLNAMYLEHWLYIPMIGVALLCATLWQNTAHPPHLQKITIVFALALALLTARTHLRARQWGDVEKFYLNEIANGGASLRILNNLGMYYADHSQLAKAEEYYQKAIDMSKDIGMPQPYFNMASLYLTQGRASDAIRQLRISLAIDHRFVYSLNLLIQIYQAMGDDRRTSALREAMGAVVAGKDYDYAGLEALVFGS